MGRRTLILRLSLAKSGCQAQALIPASGYLCAVPSTQKATSVASGAPRKPQPGCYFFNFLTDGRVVFPATLFSPKSSLAVLSSLHLVGRLSEATPSHSASQNAVNLSFLNKGFGAGICERYLLRVRSLSWPCTTRAG